MCGDRKAVIALASCSFRRHAPQQGERSKRGTGDQLDVREKHRSVSEVREKLSEMGDTISCKYAHSQAF